MDGLYRLAGLSVSGVGTNPWRHGAWWQGLRHTHGQRNSRHDDDLTVEYGLWNGRAWSLQQDWER